MNMDFFQRNDISPSKAISLAILLAIVGFILSLGLGMIVSMAISGTWDLSSALSNDLSSQQGIMSLRVIQIFQTIGLFVFPAFVIAISVSNQPFTTLGFKPVNSKTLWLSIVFITVSLPGITLLASLNAEIPLPQWMVDKEKEMEALMKTFLITDNFSVFFVNFLMVAILPAFGEELFFRSILQKYFCRLTGRIFLGVLITSILFSAIHFQFQGFIPRVLLGLIFGYFYIWSGSIWVPIVMHLFNNGIACIAYFLIGIGKISPEIENIGGIGSLWQLGVISIILSIAVLIYFKRESSISG